MGKYEFPIAFIGIVLTITGPVLIAWGFQLRDIEFRTMKGELIPFTIDVQKPIEIQVGGFHFFMTLDQLAEGFNMSKYVDIFGWDYPFRVVLRNGRFFTSVEVYNADGETVAKIVDNQWVVSADPIMARDRNYNAYAFEVIDSDMVPVIQVVFSAQNKMYIGGLFYFQDGRMLCTTRETIVNPSSQNITEHIKPIFKYPSEEHLGEMVAENPQLLGRSSSIILVGILLGIVGGIFDYRIWMSSRKAKSRKMRKPRLKRAKRKIG
jgi:hypothetical protein